MSSGGHGVANHFSPSLMLAGMDYIAPSAECILPITVRRQTDGSGGDVGAGDGGGVAYRRGEDGAKVPPVRMSSSHGDVLKITLKDCLACSGCVTTAETILVNSQSREELLKVRESQCASPSTSPPPFLVTISDPTASSVAAYAGLDTVEEGYALIAGFVRAVLGSRASSPFYVADLRWANAISTARTADEYARRFRDAPETLPLLVSACPGWVCYCEKQGSALLPHLSPVLSPQGIAGSYAKRTLSKDLYHLSLQPCFDRKLEAARDHFMPEANESAVYYTDCVLSTGELLEWMREVDPTLPWRGALDSQLAPLMTSPVRRTSTALAKANSVSEEKKEEEEQQEAREKDVGGCAATTTVADAPPPDPEQLFAATMEGSGGYHRAVMAHMLDAAAGSRAGEPATRTHAHPLLLHYEQKRNQNHQLVTSAELPAHVFCVAYGFQQIQNVVRAIKKKLPAARAYTLVELMACPDGCLNGGGQIRSADPAAAESTLQNVKAVFARSLRDSVAVAADEEGADQGEDAIAALAPPTRQCRVERPEDVPATAPFGGADPFSLARIRAAVESLGDALWHCTFTDRQKEFEKMLDQGNIQSLKW